MFVWFFVVFFKKKIQTIQCTFSAHTHTRTCTRTNGELQKNRCGNHKAQIVKRHRESHISVLNSHLAMKQQNDVLQEINGHRTHIHPNATMDTSFPSFFSDRCCYSSDSFFLAVLKFLKSIWFFFNL